MSVCIKSNLFNFDKIFITEEKEYSLQKEEKYSLQKEEKEEKYTFKKRNILYKYDFNISKQLQILTNYIDVLKCFNKYDKIKIIISDPNIIDIYNLIQNKINSETKSDDTKTKPDDVKTKPDDVKTQISISDILLYVNNNNHMELISRYEIENDEIKSII